MITLISPKILTQIIKLKFSENMLKCMYIRIFCFLKILAKHNLLKVFGQNFKLKFECEFEIGN